jgi:hypothetical protein
MAAVYVSVISAFIRTDEQNGYAEYVFNISKRPEHRSKD